MDELQIDDVLESMTEIRFYRNALTARPQLVSTRDSAMLDDLRDALRNADRAKMNIPKDAVAAYGTPWQLFIVESGEVVLQIHASPDGVWRYWDSILKDDVQLAGDSLVTFFRRIAQEDPDGNGE